MSLRAPGPVGAASLVWDLAGSRAQVRPAGSALSITATVPGEGGSSPALTQGGVLAYRALGQAGPGALQRACPSGPQRPSPSCWIPGQHRVEVSIPARLHNWLMAPGPPHPLHHGGVTAGPHPLPVEGSGSDTVVIRGPSSDVEGPEAAAAPGREGGAGRGGLCSHPAGGPAQPVSAAG